MKRKTITIVLFLALGALALFLVAGCGGTQGQNKNVAVAFANSSPSWQKNGQAIKDGLEQQGFAVTLEFADTADEQVSQIESLIAGDPGGLVIGAVDGGKLSDVLAKAKEKGSPVIAYDRLVMNTDAVSYYATYDN